MADSAPVMTWVAGSDKIFHYFNKAWLEFTGRSLEQQIGKGWTESIHPDDNVGCLAAYRAAFDKRCPFRIDFRLRRRDGVYRWIQNDANPQYDDKGDFVGYIGSCMDVTERRQTEQLFRSLVLASPVALLLVDPKGSIELVNEQQARMFGYQSDELIGQSVDLLIPESLRKQHRKYRQSFAENPSPRQMGMNRTVVGLHREGYTFPIEVGLSPIKYDERDYVIAVTVDVTERKRAEQEILELNDSLERKVRERTAELADASAAKTKFLGHMSHEIRTPLNAVLGIAQLLGREHLNPGQLAMVRHIGEAGDLLLHIVNDILDLSKIEAGQLTTECRPFRLRQVVDNIVSMMSFAVNAKGLELQIDFQPDMPEELLGDAMRLEQVLLNFTSNAVKFTDQGYITLIVKVPESNVDSATVHFEVLDTGIGMDATAQDKLFKPFSQADDTITRRFGGTGLGLSISKHIIEHMGGKLGVWSEPRQGSRFWFTIPFSKTKSPALEESPAEVKTLLVSRQLAGIRVMVVDDNRINRTVAQKALESEGASVVTANDGQQALERLLAAPEAFDAVLMDIQMPVMDGLTATQEIRGNSALSRLPVIALSAGVLEQEREAAFRVGVDDFLAKPLDLVKMVATLLRLTRPQVGLSSNG